MKSAYLFSLVLITAMLFSCSTESSAPEPKSTELAVVEELGYDSLRAQQYGADDYGMRKYIIAFLKRGPNRDLPKAEADSLQAAHMANIGRMADAGILAIAGPFFDDGDLRGIYIFAVESIEEAEELTKTDPAIQAGSLVMELKEWYGSAALMAVGEIHDKIAKIKF
jgi:uncharacterized protein